MRWNSAMTFFHKRFDPRLQTRVAGKAGKIRDEYMHRMYTGVTVNSSHLASSIILELLTAVTPTASPSLRNCVHPC